MSSWAGALFPLAWFCHWHQKKLSLSVKWEYHSYLPCILWGLNEKKRCTLSLWPTLHASAAHWSPVLPSSSVQWHHSGSRKLVLVRVFTDQWNQQRLHIRVWGVCLFLFWELTIKHLFTSFSFLLRIVPFKSLCREFPLWCKGISGVFGSAGTQVWFPAQHSGLRICCCLQLRSQLWLGSDSLVWESHMPEGWFKKTNKAVQEIPCGSAGCDSAC